MKGNRGRGAKNKTTVFDILERNGKVSVDIVSNVSANTLLASTVKKVKKGSIVYMDKWHGYDSLMFSGYKHMSVDHQKRFANGKVYINGIEGFWSFAKERMEFVKNTSMIQNSPFEAIHKFLSTHSEFQVDKKWKSSFLLIILMAS